MERKMHEVGEDSTKYGEFVCSYFAWVSLPQQKERVEELENITKKEKNNKKMNTKETMKNSKKTEKEGKK